MYVHTEMYTHVIMKYLWKPTNPVNLHVLLRGIVIMMVPYGMQNAACDKFSKQIWPKDVGSFLSLHCFEQNCANRKHTSLVFWFHFNIDGHILLTVSTIAPTCLLTLSTTVNRLLVDLQG